MQRVEPADAKIDIRKSAPPLSILKTHWTLRQLDEGQTLEVLCGDRETKEDLLHITNKSAAHKVIGVWEERSYWRILISRPKKD